MYRVELKARNDTKISHPPLMFLMYRVELKVEIEIGNPFIKDYVPNVPCGVERYYFPEELIFVPQVPNVPCGVERSTSLRTFWMVSGFLMYRVELKAKPCSFKASIKACS